MDAFTEFTVVVNDEEQYSVWPAELDVPAGWRPIGKTGTQDECARHVEEIWIDIRPLSLRTALDV